ncbi:very low-density lipoprotein receptor-like [Engraulis encrasicolus]|uniref:very low-density lipoprotein receptor-like n=1 Tax=Engraulis encrasicolus TaxID=184585 RepID=UPI002FD09354
MGHLGTTFVLIHILSWTICSGSDNQTCTKSQFTCTSKECIPRIWVCDGHQDCEDASDETLCRHRPCSGFVCTDGQCVTLSAMCDGHDDCGDGSDEIPESCGGPKCKHDEYVCANQRCVSSVFLCDNMDDCGDGSDEVSCEAPHHDPASPSTPTLRPPHDLCAPAEFRCGDGECIPHAFRCDHSEDCGDGSDERDCDKNECLENNGGCSHLCIDQPMGFLCDCPPGMRLVADGNCEEIDECLSGDVCSQICVHTNGTLTCACREGYTQGPHTGECIAAGDAAVIAFSSSAGLRSIDPLGREYRQVTGSPSAPGPVAALVANRSLYWAASEHGAIYRTTLEGNRRQTEAILRSHGTILGLAVDWLHHLLYWTNANSHSLNVASLDGAQKRVLVGGLSKPTGVAVEPLEGLLFWADAGTKPRIERSSLDGRGRTALVTSALQVPVAIAVDLPRGLLYWADAGTRSVSRVRFDGQQRKTVLESNGYLDRPSGLVVFEGRVFWTDQASGTLCGSDRDAGSSPLLRLGQGTTPGGLAILHPVLQPQGKTQCGSCTSACVADFFNTEAPPRFTCSSPSDATGKALPLPSLTADLSDASFAWLVSSIVLLSLLLVGLLWWWRRLTPPSAPHSATSTLGESCDPLMPTVALKETA